MGGLNIQPNFQNVGLDRTLTLSGLLGMRRGGGDFFSGALQFSHISDKLNSEIIYEFMTKKVYKQKYFPLP